eukprot:TRINITY_DN9344_c0_g1::TRINITY_DN9344_c0_g1_i1::g.28414::m.28414 TRINITY_DN9344_c0_g1::TRINITY_DN9344_c0_g1_i1::g.28414  ORF type:complete len:288 (-),score=43.64,sp/Q9C8L2/FAP3_ARATH/24.72/4e-08,Chalcone/PF02431.10/8.5e-23 TRINITY_DN9344_c0_g1_i1:417-1238(-)
MMRYRSSLIPLVLQTRSALHGAASSKPCSFTARALTTCAVNNHSRFSTSWITPTFAALAAMTTFGVSCETIETEEKNPTDFPKILELRPWRKLESVGHGLRKMLGIYTAYSYGLYIDANEASRIAKLHADQPDVMLFDTIFEPKFDKCIRMVVLRPVNGTHLIKGFSMGVSRRLKNLQANGMNDGHESLKTMNTFFTNRNFEVGSEILFTWLTCGTLIVTLNGEEMSSICDPALCRAVFEMFIGPAAASKPARDAVRVALSDFEGRAKAELSE